MGREAIDSVVLVSRRGKGIRKSLKLAGLWSWGTIPPNSVQLGSMAEKNKHEADGHDGPYCFLFFLKICMCRNV